MPTELLDAIPTSENLKQLLLDCAAAAPRPEVDPERVGDGFRAATAILGRADEAGLGAEADGILEGLMHDPDVDRVWLAMTFLPLERQAAHGLADMNPHAMHAFAYETWRLNLRLAVARGLLPWQEPYRWLVDGTSDLGVFAALLGWDPAFALEHWRTTFGDAIPRATQRLLYAMGEPTSTRCGAYRTRCAGTWARCPPTSRTPLPRWPRSSSTGTSAPRRG